jgi:hypothetical protein
MTTISEEREIDFMHRSLAISIANRVGVHAIVQLGVSHNGVCARDVARLTITGEETQFSMFWKIMDGVKGEWIKEMDTFIQKCLDECS